MKHSCLLLAYCGALFEQQTEIVLDLLIHRRGGATNGSGGGVRISETLTPDSRLRVADARRRLPQDSDLGYRVRQNLDRRPFPLGYSRYTNSWRIL